jgi:hypothetical protein
VRLLTSCIVTVERQQTQAQQQPRRVDDTVKDEDSHDAVSEPEKKERNNPLGGLFHRSKDEPDTKDASIASSTEKDEPTQRRSQKTALDPSDKPKQPRVDRSPGTLVSQCFVAF